MQLLFGDGSRDARFQACDRERPTLLAGVNPQGQPDSVVGPPPEAWRHDADDGVRLVIQAERLAQNVGVAAKELLPTAEAQHGDRLRLSCGANVRRLNRAAEQRRYAE